ncbi:dehydrogenase/reductase SDR family member 4-like [Hippocampus zosterae]|uniref:dehydrogenase/reductase SDR family member 4-like n=1 Tax=Hippocampus zosterae TaxID=109293 RepID=UPI00223CCA75|nr:dehydrogenase/reductase SDR family member 4-like [Hippocampus zosterae]
MEGLVFAITASASGIGLGIALEAAKQGAVVIVSSRNQAHVDSALELVRRHSPKSVGVVCHVGKAADRQRMVELALTTFGRIDALVLNAASEAQVSKMWEINYTATYRLAVEALPALRKSSSGSIVVLSSISAYEPRETRMISHYGATKAALLHLTKQLALELPELKVNAVAPGIIKTRFSEGLWKGREKEVEEASGVRLGEVEDVANVVLFLAHPKTTYITGETIIVAGKPSPRL